MLTHLHNRWSMTRDVVKLSCLKHRNFDGYFATMHQSGNHWMRHLLAMVISLRFNQEPPEHLADMRLVGEPRCPTMVSGIPRLVFSHKICSPLVHSAISRAFVRFPRYVVMVRDLRTMLVSNYERFKDRYQMSFSDYLRGDVTGRRFDCDIWDSVRFQNAWGRVCQRLPEQTLVLRYEELRVDVVSQAMRVWEFLELHETDRSIFERAASESTKDKLKSKEAGANKQGTVVRADGGDPLMRYAPKDRVFFMDVCDRYLHQSFGYDYRWFESAPAHRKAA